MYAGRAPDEDIEYRETAIQPEMLDKLYLKSSESMEELPDYSVHLMVTSPPYNVQKEYDQDLTLEEYTGLLRRVFAEVYRVLVTGGRACVNVANLGRKPYIPLHSIIIEEMLGLGFFMRGEIIWDKAASASPSTAWGSWMSATNPVLRDVHEYILVFSKEAFRREREEAVSTIERDEFLEWTKSVWSFPAVSARQVGHPAPFPEELPRRLIELYSFQDDVVLDPFAGSGTTCVAAKRTGRHYIGYETEHEYRQLAIQRLSAVDNEQEG
jgi:site-specific DNA-methyltransferase (adenine-specific)